MPSITIELTPAQHAALMMQIGADADYDPAKYLADLPILHARREQEWEDERFVRQRYGNIAASALFFAVRCLLPLGSDNTANVMQHFGQIAKSPKRDGEPEKTQMLGEHLIGLFAHIIEEKEGGLTAPQLDAQARIIAEMDE